jgi:hypothetical protein
LAGATCTLWCVRNQAAVFLVVYGEAATAIQQRYDDSDPDQTKRPTHRRKNLPATLAEAPPPINGVTLTPTNVEGFATPAA